MTFAEGSIGAMLHCKLTEHGLWPKEADAVMESLQTVVASSRMRLNTPASEHPAPVIRTTWLRAKKEALAYIDAFAPEHFARTWFEENKT